MRAQVDVKMPSRLTDYEFRCEMLTEDARWQQRLRSLSMHLNGRLAISNLCSALLVNDDGILNDVVGRANVYTALVVEVIV